MERTLTFSCRVHRIPFDRYKYFRCCGKPSVFVLAISLLSQFKVIDTVKSGNKPRRRRPSCRTHGGLRGRYQRGIRFEPLEHRHLLAANLLAHWNANDLNASHASNSIVADWTDGVDEAVATASGSPRLVKNAVFDRSVLRFEPRDGLDSFSVADDDSPMSGRGDFTLSIVFSTTQSLASRVDDWYDGINLIDTTVFQGVTTSWGVSLNERGQVLAGVGGPAATLTSSIAGLNDGRAHVAVFSKMGDTISLTVDSHATDVLTGVSESARASVTMFFGKGRRGGTPFDGDLADIRFYDAALTEGEKSELVDQLVDKYISPVYDPAFAIPDEYLVDAGQGLTVDAARGVLRNDQNIDELDLSATLVRPASAGELVFESDGSFTYDPGDFRGIASFSYRLNDSVADQNEVDVILLVDAIPSPADDFYSVDEDDLLLIDAEMSVLRNDFDAEGDALFAVLVDPPNHGSLSFSGEGTFVYRPDLDFFGTDTFTYFVDDGDQVSMPATVSVEVVPVNDPPVAVADGYYLAANESIHIGLPDGVLANDIDVDGDRLTVTLVTQPERGRVTLEPDGTFVYSPASHFVGIERFQYQISDGVFDSAIASAELYVGVPPVEISEFVVENHRSRVTRTRDSVDSGFSGDIESYDWIEIRNLSSSPYDLGRMILADDRISTDAELAEAWRFPRGTMVAPHGQVVVFASGLDIRDRMLDEQGLLHTNFRLSDAGDQVILANVDGTFRHGFANFPDQVPDVSFGVGPNGVGYLAEPSPGAPNAAVLSGLLADVSVSVSRGFYAAPLEVALSSPSGATVYYTLDGSLPTEETGQIYSHPLSISETTTLRARAIRDGYVDSRVATHSYFFLDDILAQPTNPTGFPERWGNAGLADYEMDARVTTDVASPYFDDSVAEGLLALPTISVVMDVEDFFGDRVGIQSSPSKRGIDWERATSVEFIGFGQFEDYQLDAGIRMVGNASRGADRRKHNMRLAFRDDYGFSQLELPLFGIADGEVHDNLILRGGNGDSWVNSGVYRRAQYIRDQWQRDVQFAMGHESTHQLYSHLYINGLYWGLYHVFERHDASFMALNFGGDEEDYEAIKDVNGTSGVEAVSGDTDAWLALMELVDGDLSVDEKYEAVEDRVDLDNLIDYLLLNFYHGNNDWDHNNFRTGRPKDGKFVFFTWDAERADLNALGVPATQYGSILRDITTFSKPNRPTRIHTVLSQSLEYRLRFADRVQRHFYNDGVLTPAGASALWNKRADEIRLAMSAESARWGDLHTVGDVVQTVADWEATLAIMNEEFFPQRTNIVLDQFRRRSLLPSLDAPLLGPSGGTLEAGSTVSLLHRDEAIEGAIWYTVDGSDPRQSGGGISPSANRYRDSVALYRETTVNARVLFQGEWSALTSATFGIERSQADLESLRISEINYHPGPLTPFEVAAGVLDVDEFEFIELIHIGDEPIQLSDVELLRIDGEGVEFPFSSARFSELWPGERAVVVENAAAFAVRYGESVPVLGEWLGGLSNRSERITLSVGGELRQLTYRDEWFPGTDGGGRTLELIDATDGVISGSQRNAWRASTVLGGTPGLSAVSGDFSGDGRIDGSDLELLHEQVRVGLDSLTFDIDGDGHLGLSDLHQWLTSAGFEFADVTLDGRVDASDLNAWIHNRFTSHRGWSRADVNADGVTDGSDFNRIHERIVDVVLAEDAGFEQDETRRRTATRNRHLRLVRRS